MQVVRVEMSVRVPNEMEIFIVIRGRRELQLRTTRKNDGVRETDCRRHGGIRGQSVAHLERLFYDFFLIKKKTQGCEYFVPKSEYIVTKAEIV